MVDPVISVESFSTSMASGTNSVTLNLTEGQDPDNCVARVTATRNGTAAAFANRTFLRARFLSGPARVVIDRGTSGGTGALDRIEVFVEEFDPTEVTVQQEEFSGSGATINNTITAVDLDKTYIVSSMRGNPVNSDSSPREMFHEADFSSTTNLRMRAGSGGDTYDFSVFVVEDIGSNWDVQTVTWTASTTQDDETITSVDTATTFLTGSYQSDENLSDPDESSAMVELLNANTVRFTTANTSANARTATVFVVECGSSVASVQRGKMQMNGSNTDTDTITAVDLSRSVASFCMGPSGAVTTGINDSSTSGDWDETYCSLRYTSTTVLEGERDNGNDITDLSWESIEWLSGAGPANEPTSQFVLA